LIKKGKFINIFSSKLAMDAQTVDLSCCWGRWKEISIHHFLLENTPKKPHQKLPIDKEDTSTKSEDN